MLLASQTFKKQAPHSSAFELFPSCELGEAGTEAYPPCPFASQVNHCYDGEITEGAAWTSHLTAGHSCLAKVLIPELKY